MELCGILDSEWFEECPIISGLEPQQYLFNQSLINSCIYILLNNMHAHKQTSNPQ